MRHSQERVLEPDSRSALPRFGAAWAGVKTGQFRGSRQSPLIWTALQPSHSQVCFHVSEK